MCKRKITSILMMLALVFAMALSAAAADTTAQYGTWDAATTTVAPEGTPVSYTLETYNSDVTANQIWVAINVEKANQAIRFSWDGVACNSNAYLFRESTLKAGNFDANSALFNWTLNADGSYAAQWKADTAGTYYMMLRPRNSNSTTTKASTLTCTLVEGDLNESNDSWETATELTENVNTYYDLIGQNDVDWFKITTAVPGEAIKLQFSNFDYTVSNISAYLYTEDAVKAGKTGSNTNDPVWYWTNFSDNGTSNYKANTPGNYYLKIEPYKDTDYVTKDLKLSYTTVQPDANEPNDSYDTAATIGYAYPMEFTLNGINDKDWFYFETTEPNEVVYLYLSGFETDYSNNIRYYVYDATEDGYGSALENSYGINRTHSAVMSFSNVGGHYIMIETYNKAPAVENTLTLRIEQGTTDALEPNDTWQTATPMAENVGQSFNLPSETDVDWFVFTTTAPNQTVELTITSPLGSNGYIRMFVYSGADFIQNGDNAAAMGDFYVNARVTNNRLMLRDVGDYYVKVYGWNSGDVFDDNATITYTLIAPDANERNNSWKTATVLNADVATAYTLPAHNDVDWFKFTTTEPNQTVELTITSPLGSNGYIRMFVYSGADFIQNGDDANAMGDYYINARVTNNRLMLRDAGDYYVQVYGWNSGDIFDDNATITYTLIAPDENERNNSWKTATVLNAGVATAYTLPAHNDVDWFKFTTTEANQTVELTTTSPLGNNGYIRMFVYSGADFIQNGDNAAAMGDFYVNASVTNNRLMLRDAGDYYVQVYGWNSGDIFDNDATITYTLISPDGNERNNVYTSATELSAGNVAYFTIPAPNDADYFHIGRLTAGDVLQTTLGNLSSVSHYKMEVYVLKDDVDHLTHVTTVHPGDGTRYFKWNIETDGEYYLCISHFSVETDMDRTMWLRYAVTAADKPVTGISSITNGGSTIFEGKTLQLYANIAPTNATNQNVSWSSSDETVATIDANGLVTGVAPGTTTITATTEDGSFTASTLIEVVAPVSAEAVTVTAGDVAHKGETEDNPYFLALDTSVTVSASVQPETATEKAVIWSSSNEEVAQVNIYGQVFAVGSGDAIITATTVDGGFTANFYINVPDENYPVRGISLNYNAATLYMGEGGLELIATVNPSYATNPAVKWSSDNEAVATVDQNGHITAVGVGYATITVSAVENNAITNSCIVSVQPVRTRVEGISFAETEVKVGIYSTVQLLPIITPDDATDKSVVWTTDNKTVATVSRNGEVTALNIGVATITATTVDGEFVAQVKIYVSSTAEMGDLNNDGDVDAGDALLILRSSVGLVKLSAAQAPVADVNGDKEIDAGDAILILRYDAGLIDSFPAEKK